MVEFRNKLIQDLYDLNVNADITIEELADDIIDDIQNIVGRDYVKILTAILKSNLHIPIR